MPIEYYANIADYGHGKMCVGVTSEPATEEYVEINQYNSDLLFRAWDGTAFGDKIGSYISEPAQPEQTPEQRLSQLESENQELKSRIRSAEYAAYENSATAQGILELLIDMEVI